MLPTACKDDRSQTNTKYGRQERRFERNHATKHTPVADPLPISFFANFQAANQKRGVCMRGPNLVWPAQLQGPAPAAAAPLRFPVGARAAIRRAIRWTSSLRRIPY